MHIIGWSTAFNPNFLFEPRSSTKERRETSRNLTQSASKEQLLSIKAVMVEKLTHCTALCSHLSVAEYGIHEPLNLGKLALHKSKVKVEQEYQLDNNVCYESCDQEL